MPRFEFDNGIVHITIDIQQPPLDRGLLDKGLKDRLDTFRTFVPAGDPRWLEVERLGLKDLDKVIDLGLEYCYRDSDVDKKLAAMAGVVEKLTGLASVAGILENLTEMLHAIETGEIGPGPPARVNARAAEESDWEEESDDEGEPGRGRPTRRQ
ncbi:hypothetical protein MIND_00002100 [Mycena indigotica]|uniref:Uncharacterized protein n=1 Tax=Mycena indigotica TaxID=2126181 RepID=A0A8H6TCN9_9AGAR|nr:uncharacterized protein MIND_00002100 [Mycena indigotica]KAF7314884.1 hypothetical protein MIND_00002100 [Mycena indigotica]